MLNYDVYLTDSGSKYAYELKESDKVRIYNTDKGMYEWSKILEYTSTNTPYCNVQCENGFRVYSNRLYHATNNEFYNVNNLYEYENIQHINVKQHIEPRGNHNSKIFYEFVGMFLADGYIVHHKGNKGNTIEFHVTKMWKRRKIILYCELLNLNYTYKDYDDGTVHIYIFDDPFVERFFEFYDENHDHQKRFPKRIWGDMDALCGVCRGLMFDANLAGRRWQYSTSDFLLACDFCYALGLLGIKHTLFKNHLNVMNSNWRDNYRVRFGKDYNPMNECKVCGLSSFSVKDNVKVVAKGDYPIVRGVGGMLC